MNNFVHNVLYASIGFLIGAYLITHVNFKVEDAEIKKYSKLCQDKVEYYSIDFKGDVLYVYCKNKEKKVITKPESKLSQG